jgi:hypothetical protein
MGPWAVDLVISHNSSNFVAVFIYFQKDCYIIIVEREEITKDKRHMAKTVCH